MNSWGNSKRKQSVLKKGRTPQESCEFLKIMEFTDNWERLMQAKMASKLYHDQSLLTKDIVRKSMKKMVNYWCPSFSNEGKKERCQVG